MAENGNGDPGWNCSDCGKLPCVCPNLLTDASIALMANVENRSAIIQIQDNETGNKMAVELSLTDGARIAQNLHEMLRALAIMRIVLDD